MTAALLLFGLSLTCFCCLDFVHDFFIGLDVGFVIFCIIAEKQVAEFAHERTAVRKLSERFFFVGKVHCFKCLGQI